LKPNGTFDVEVPPGTFDLNLKIFDPRLVRQRTVGNAIVVDEGKPTVIERP
jgi:hypothetical protein